MTTFRDLCISFSHLKRDAKIRLDVQESYWWEDSWRVEGRAREGTKSSQNKMEVTPMKEGGRKSNGVGRVSDCHAVPELFLSSRGQVLEPKPLV